MQLSDFKTTVDNEYIIRIDFGSGYENLVFVLEWLYEPEAADEQLKRLYYLRGNWESLDEFVDKEYGGYFDDYILAKTDKSGTWFTFWSWADVCILVNKDKKEVHLEYEFSDDLPPVILPLNEFIDVIEQWKTIVAAHENNPTIKRKRFWERIKGIFR